MSKIILAKEDVEGDAPARELAYYGQVRRGFEEARSGLEKVIESCKELASAEPNNYRLQRYVQALQKTLDKIHRLNMAAARIRDRHKPRKTLMDRLHDNPLGED